MKNKQFITLLASITLVAGIFLLALGCKKSGSSVKEDKDKEQNEITIPDNYLGYDLIWNDEFDADVLNQKNWNIEIGTGIDGNFGTGQLDRATGRDENLSIKKSIKNAQANVLAITTVKETYMDRQYTSGRINTKDKFSFGPGSRIEARIWARDVKYKGQGFAFWMMPAEIPPGENHLMWPQGGEIDIMEYVGAIPYHNLGSLHYAWSWEDNKYQSWNHGHRGAYFSYEQKQTPVTKPGYGGWPAPENDINAGSGGFHKYRVDWFNNRIEFSVDEQVYHISYFEDGASKQTAPDGKDEEIIKTVNGKNVLYSEYVHHFNQWKPFDHKFYIILSAGVGGDDNRSYGGKIVPEAQFPCNVFVDWVRVYKRK